jgi:hypothetical protein
MTLPNVVRNKTTSISQGCDNNNKVRIFDGWGFISPLASSSIRDSKGRFPLGGEITKQRTISLRTQNSA